MKKLIIVKHTNKKNTFLHVVEFQFLDLSRFNILLTNFPLFGSEKCWKYTHNKCVPLHVMKTHTVN